MNQFVESLRRLYLRNSIDEQKVNKLLEDNKITEAEKDWILAEENDVEKSEVEENE